MPQPYKRKPLRIKALKPKKYFVAIQKKDSVLVCVPGLSYPGFPDNLHGKCEECGCDITYRPYNKYATKKVCISCAIKLIDKEHLEKDISYG